MPYIGSLGECHTSDFNALMYESKQCLFLLSLYSVYQDGLYHCGQSTYESVFWLSHIVKVTDESWPQPGIAPETIKSWVRYSNLWATLPDVKLLTDDEKSLVQIDIIWDIRTLKIGILIVFSGIFPLYWGKPISIIGEVIRPLQQWWVWKADCLRNCNQNLLFLAKLFRYTLFHHGFIKKPKSSFNEIENRRILFLCDGFRKTNLGIDLIASAFWKSIQKKDYFRYFLHLLSVPSLIFSKNGRGPILAYPQRIV